MHPLQARVMRFLWIYEALAISVCVAGGLMIATGGGGSVLLALPLFLIAAAELMRIPVSGWAVHLRWTGKLVAVVVLSAIAIASFEGLALIFEMSINNRLINVTAAERVLYHAQDALAAKETMRHDIQVELDAAKQKVAMLDADIKNKEANQPAQPSVSSKPCVGKNGRSYSCSSDTTARKDYSLQLATHRDTLKALRTDRGNAQNEVDSLVSRVAAVDTSAEVKSINNAKSSVADSRRESPFHGLAASWWGVKVGDLTEDQFESFKKYVVFGLAGAFASLSMFASIVAHSAARDDEYREQRHLVFKSIRAWVARHRKKVVAIREVPGPERVVEVEKIVEVEKPVTVVKYLPQYVPANELEIRRGKGMATFSPKRPEPIPTAILEVKAHG